MPGHLYKISVSSFACAGFLLNRLSSSSCALSFPFQGKASARFAVSIRFHRRSEFALVPNSSAASSTIRPPSLPGSQRRSSTVNHTSFSRFVFQFSPSRSYLKDPADCLFFLSTKRGKSRSILNGSESLQTYFDWPFNDLELSWKGRS